MSAETTFFPLHSLYLNLTDRCNLRCRHCWLSPETIHPFPKPADLEVNEKGAISLSLMKNVISQTKPLGLHTVKLTGGEPFLRSDVMNFISLFHDEGLNIDIETNGPLIDRPTAHDLGVMKVRGVSVSLDSANIAMHDWFRGVKGAYSAAIKGIENLVGGGVQTQIIMSLSRENADQIERMAHLSTDLGVNLLKINPVLPIGRGNKMHREKRTLSVEELIGKFRWVKEELQPTLDIPLQFSLPIAFQPLREIMRGSYPECAILNILGIVENGDISFCGIQRVQKDLVIGNVRRDRLEVVWMNHPLLKRMRGLIPGQLEGICGKCFFRKRCMGSCLACTYYLRKSFVAPYWFCQEAFQKGLFPETRYMEGPE